MLVGFWRFAAANVDCVGDADAEQPVLDGLGDGLFGSGPFAAVIGGVVCAEICVQGVDQLARGGAWRHAGECDGFEGGG